MHPHPLPLEEVLSHYRQENLLEHEAVVKELAPKIRDIPEIELRKRVNLLRIWPLVVKYSILDQKIGNQLSRAEEEKLANLDIQMSQLEHSPDMQVLDNIQYDKLNVRYLNPTKMHPTEIVDMMMSLDCEGLLEHINKTHRGKTKIIQDAEMSGSVYIAGIDELAPPLTPVKYSFFERAFVCIEKENQEPILFIDSLEGGEDYYKKLDHWRGMNEEGQFTGKNRIHHVYLALAASMYVAEQLGMRYVVPRDFELVDFARSHGMRTRTIFDKEQKDHWKIGIRSSKSRTGIYTHSLYRAEENNKGHQLDHRILAITPYQTPQNMISRLDSLFEKTTESKISLRRSRNAHTLGRAILALHQLITNYQETPASRKEYATERAKEFYEAIGGKWSDSDGTASGEYVFTPESHS